MAVRIRLLRMGKIRMPQYRIVVADARTKRDGRAIEYVGTYQPKHDPSLIEVNSERVQYWLSVGAQPSGAVQKLLEKTGDWQKFKGLPAPEPLKQPTVRRDKRAIYEAEAKAVLAAAEGADAKAEPKAERKRTAKKAEKPEKAEKAEKAEKPETAETAETADKPAATEQEEKAVAETGPES